MTHAGNEAGGHDDAAEEQTRQIGSAPSPADGEETQVVTRFSGPSVEHSTTGDDAGEKTHVVPRTPGGDVPPPPPQQRVNPAPQAPSWPPSAPSPSAPPPPSAPQGGGFQPPYPPPGGPGQGWSGAPHPHATPYGAGPGGPSPGGATPPPPPPGAFPGGPSYPPPGPPPQSAASAQELLNKGNNVIAKLMERGVRGDLIKQPWFQNFRRQQPDQFVYVSFAIGLVLCLVFALLPGLLSLVLSAGVWVGLAYLLFAVGTKKAHQFIVYGICLVGGLLFLLGALFALTGALSLSGLPYVAGGTILMLIITAAGSVVIAAALGYVGVQVHRGIQRMSAGR